MGIINSSYLVWKHYKKMPLVCPLDHDCGVVTESKWSKFFFIRNGVLGMFFFIALLLGILTALFIPSLAQGIFSILLLVTGGGLLFSLFLVFIQIHVIKDYCFYCIISASITLFIFLNSILLYLS